MDERLSSETLDNLVTQFSSVWDFLRELVQNSIDAGSSSVEVWTEFQVEEGQSEGVISIHVDDFGEGMTEEIIDDQLTQLFSSAKENDLTKIGKFGIGFVSVFALKPKGVLVHTGRGGECWEVFFHEDLSFTKTRIEGPVEGTQLTLFLAGDRARYAEVVERVQSTLRHWCRHSETEIGFEDRSALGGSEYQRINEDFEVAGELPALHEEGELELALSYSRRPVYGFYNRGLALAVGHDAEGMLGEFAGRFPHVAFKVKSPWLEHTLSRETVMRDEHFEQAMRVATAAADRVLHAGLVRELRELVALPRWDLDEQARYAQLIAFLMHEPEVLLLEGPSAEAPILRGLRGGAHSLAELHEVFRAQGQVFASREPTRLAELLLEHGHPVLLELSQDAGRTQVGHLVARYVYARLDRRLHVRVMRRLGVVIDDPGAVVVSPESRARAVNRVVKASPRLAALLAEVRDTLRRAGHKVAGITAGEIEGGDEAPPLFVVGDELSPVMVSVPVRPSLRAMLRGKEVVVDYRHPHLVAMLDQYEALPSLAVGCLAKALCLHDLAPDADDGVIFSAAREVVGGGRR